VAPRQDSRLTDAPALARVRAALLAWYATDHRDFPWRRT
jgi:adenine-specific DNA glycosylase